MTSHTSRRASRQALGDERGSLAIAMLAMLIVAGLVTTLVATVVAGQRGARADQGYEQTLAVAEVGLERLAVQVQANPTAAAFAAETGTVDVGGGRTVAYAATAAREPGTATGWVVTSTGVASDGARRQVHMRVGLRGLFTLAAFGRDGVNMVGGNAADAYDSRITGGSALCEGTTPVDPGNNSIEMCHRHGTATIGTNGVLKLRNNTVAAIIAAGTRVNVYHAKPRWITNALPGATGDCDTNCDPRTFPGLAFLRRPHTVVPDPFSVDLPPFAAIASLGSFPASDPTPGGCTPAPGKTSCLPPGLWEFDAVALDGSVDVQGTRGHPTIIGMDGELTVRGHVNFEPDEFTGLLVPRPPASLQILSAGPSISLRAQSSLAAALYAPNVAFSGCAQCNVYGSVVASSIDTNGGWGFHYDVSLADVTTLATPLQLDWSEL